MPKTREELHGEYLDYIRELRRLKAEKYGEQLEFDFHKYADLNDGHPVFFEVVEMET